MGWTYAFQAFVHRDKVSVIMATFTCVLHVSEGDREEALQQILCIHYTNMMIFEQLPPSVVNAKIITEKSQSTKG